MAAARKPKRHVCELGVEISSVLGWVHVDLLCDEEKVGELNAYSVDPATLERDCFRALRSISRTMGRPPGEELIPFVVFRADMAEDLRGLGIGTALYLAAVEGVSRIGGALIQHACYRATDKRRGATSELARAVWGGGRFGAETVTNRGVVAVLPQEHWGRAVQMLTFGQMEIGLRHRITRAFNPSGDKQRFGAALHEAMGRNVAFRILDRHERVRGRGWLSGGCAILAAALHRWYPGFSYAGIEQDGIVHHVLVRSGRLYFDADGAATKRQLRKRWREHESLPRAHIVSLEPHPGAPVPDLRERGEQIPILVDAVNETITYLRSCLGSPAQWGFVQANPSEHRLSGASARCDYEIVEGERSRICVIDTDDGRPANMVQVRQLIAAEDWADA